MTLEERCAAYLKERWEKFSPDAKRILRGDGRHFLLMMWERDFYRDLCIELQGRDCAVQNRRTPCQPKR